MTKLTLRGVPVEVNPLTIAGLKVLREDVKLVMTGFGPTASDEVFDAMLRVAGQTVAGDLPAGGLAELIDLGNFTDLWSAILGVPVVRRPGEATGQA